MTQDSDNVSAGVVPDDPYPWLTGVHTLTVPVLPTVAQRAVSLASDPEVPVYKLSDLVAKDQVLASRVLTMANSAYSSPLMPITTIQDAVVRMGTVSVRNAVLAASLQSLSLDPRVYGGRGRALFEHALGAAYMARLTADEVNADVDEAFLAGLMHDIGKLVIYKRAHEWGVMNGAVPADVLERAVAERHAMMGGLALRRWSLPQSVDDPVMFHHDYAAAPRLQREAAICYLANRLCHRYGFGCPKDDEQALLGDPVFEFLGLGAEWLAKMDESAPGLVRVASSTLG